MRCECHRKYAIEAFQEYENDQIDKNKIRQIDVSKIEIKYSERLDWPNIVYILRLNLEKRLDASVLAVPNRNDKKNILYIGGHKKGVGGTRYLDLIESSRKAEKDYAACHESAFNDRAHAHPVAGCLTTSLLKTKFSINDCIIDVFSCSPKYNELEFIIGYQEKYHHLPPWNSLRKGEQGFQGECTCGNG